MKVAEEHYNNNSLFYSEWNGKSKKGFEQTGDLTDYIKNHTVENKKGRAGASTEARRPVGGYCNNSVNKQWYLCPGWKQQRCWDVEKFWIYPKGRSFKISWWIGYECKREKSKG